MTSDPKSNENSRKILTKLYACIDKITAVHFDFAPSSKDIAELDGLVIQLRRAGAQHAVEAGFNSIIEILTLLLTRLQVRISRNFSAQTSANPNVPNHDILDPPQEVLKAFPILNALIQLQLQVAADYAKFNHVMRLGKMSDSNTEHKSDEKPSTHLEGDSRENARGKRRTEPKRLRISKGH